MDSTDRMRLLENNGTEPNKKVDNYKSTFLANFVAFLQEFLAVTFHLVCLSRLEKTAGLQSSLVLFLTLVVFTGPYLNAWLLFIHNIWFKPWTTDKLDEEEKKKYMPYYFVIEKIVMGIAIAGAHVAGSAAAYDMVKSNRPQWNSSITWELHEPTTDETWHVHFTEELFAVASLFIGCVYLLWLKKMREAKIKDHEKDIKIAFTFYWQLTLLVTAVSQAFPSAGLSPHVLCYKVFMKQIPDKVFWARIGGGGAGLALACIWRYFRVTYREHIQADVDSHNEHHDKVSQQTKQKQLQPQRKMPGFRLSMHGGSYI
jgi:hypothetical protein